MKAGSGLVSEPGLSDCHDRRHKQEAEADRAPNLLGYPSCNPQPGEQHVTPWGIARQRRSCYDVTFFLAVSVAPALLRLIPCLLMNRSPTADSRLRSLPLFHRSAYRPGSDRMDECVRERGTWGKQP